ncbi:MAG TPA: TonB-dependent receptor, partial [Cellvibrio sp.]|nr:TonB-dependent receptor [Cellvibrio sp.]
MHGLIAGVLGTLGLLPSLAAAADYMEMDLEQLLQVSVTGSTLRDEQLNTVPSVVSVFTREQINSLGVDYLYELLALVPGFQVDRAGDTGTNYTYSLRGRRNGAQARELLLLVDGRLFSSPRSGSSDIVIPLFPVVQIERVEIIRGPGSALYGSSAFTGVINVVTRKREAKVRVVAGSDQRAGVDVLWGQEMGNWETAFYGHAHEDQGQDFALRDLVTPVAVPSTDPNRALHLDWGLRYDQTQLRIAYIRTESSDFYSIERIRNDFNHNLQGFGQVSLEQGFALADNLKSTLALSYTQGEQRVKTEIAPEGVLFNLSSPASSDAFVARATFKGETYRLALANDWSISERASSQFGLELREDSETQAQAFGNYSLAEFVARDYPVTYYGDESPGEPVGTRASQKSLGVYGQYLRQLAANTKLTLGLRYDNYDDFDDHLSPRLGLVQQITGNQALKLLYGEAFRAPSQSETGLINNTRLVGNPDLKHELVKTWDLVWVGNWQRSSFSVNSFYSRYDQPIYTGLIGATRTYINGASETSKGVSLEASQQLSSNWLARITYSHFLDLPDSAFREADEIGSLMLNYHRQQWNWNIAGVHQGARETAAPGNTRGLLDSYWVVNSKLAYQVTPALG